MGSPYKAIADDKRRDILTLLSKGDSIAGDIANKFKITKPAISHHLRVLKDANLVSEKKVQKIRIYSLNKSEIRKIKNFLEKLL